VSGATALHRSASNIGLRSADLEPEGSAPLSKSIVVVTGDVPSAPGDYDPCRVGDHEPLTDVVEGELVQRAAERLGLDLLEDAVGQQRERTSVRRRPRLPELIVIGEEDVAVELLVGAPPGTGESWTPATCIT